MRTPRQRLAFLAAALLAVFVVSGCNPKPRQEHVQWVARDAWNAKCAEVAMVERWKQESLSWVEKGARAKVDVDATFKLGNDCEELKAYQSFDFQLKGLELVKCTSNGEGGWALPGKEAERCWTGPRLLPAEQPPAE